MYSDGPLNLQQVPSATCGSNPDRLYGYTSHSKPNVGSRTNESNFGPSYDILTLENKLVGTAVIVMHSAIPTGVVDLEMLVISECRAWDSHVPRPFTSCNVLILEPIEVLSNEVSVFERIGIGQVDKELWAKFSS